MTSDPTSLAQDGSARGEWRAWLAFLRRPRLPDAASRVSRAGLAGVVRMLALDLMLMAAIVTIAGIALLLGVELPRTALADVEITPLLALAIVLGAPLFEEIVFRGWLSGRPGHVLPIVIIGVGLAILTTDLTRSEAEVNWKAISVVAASLVLALLTLWLFRRRGPMRWFTRIFPLLFWLSTLAFALIHLFNYEEGAAAVLLALVVPQFVTGSILGYVRVRFGLWASILLHALHNGTILALVTAGTALA